MSVCVKTVIKIEIEKKNKKSWYIFFVHIAQPYSEGHWVQPGTSKMYLIKWPVSVNASKVVIKRLGRWLAHYVAICAPNSEKMQSVAAFTVTRDTANEVSWVSHV